tara:strand:+ start:2037 stop:3353 length:1317 start_codon:yes stop_codon:yes gene_type:complete
MILELIHAYGTDKLTVEESIGDYLSRIEELDDQFKAIIHKNERALDDARELDHYKKKTNKLKGKLHGVPVVLKANIETNDSMPTSCGSVLLKDHFSNKNAEIVKWLISEGAVILGKSNMSEWSNYVSSSSESGYSSLGGQTICIYGSQHPVGGSSSGSAVAVAASFCLLAFGTETDGSVVYPAAHNGVYAFKNSPGRFPTLGIKGISTFFDTIGFYTRSLEDLKFITDILYQHSLDEQSFGTVFIEENSFTLSDQSKNVLLELKSALNNNSINYNMGTFFQEIDPYFEFMDIICQTEFKNNITSTINFTSKEFLESCRKNLLQEFYKDINEIERSFSSNFDLSGEYSNAKERILQKRSEKQFLMAKEGIDFIIAITLGPSDISSIAMILGLPHLVVPVSTGEFLPIGISIIGSVKKEEMMFKLAEILRLHLNGSKLEI